jgi:hypothetical protein
MSNKKLSQYEKDTTREVTIGGVKSRVRKLPPSKEALKGLGLRTHRDIVGHMAINPPDIARKFAMQKAEIMREMTLMSAVDRERFIDKGPIDFVVDKDGRQKYELYCSGCGEKVAYVWARNEKLDDWCDLHYLCSYNKESWKGALAINVSPIDGKIGIECACGEDTRDHRANKTLPPIAKRLMIEYSMKHRDFGDSNSRFAAIAI